MEDPSNDGDLATEVNELDYRSGIGDTTSFVWAMPLRLVNSPRNCKFKLATGRKKRDSAMNHFWLVTSLILASLSATLTRAVEPIPLRAGPVTMSFDAENVFLRYIRMGRHEILRGINAPVRNKNWATIAPKVSNLQVDDRGDSFDVTFDVLCQNSGIDFRWKGSISGNKFGQIEFAFDGEAHSTFKKNRIGFCVLHGPSAAGQPWSIETPDGKTSRGAFPKFISPHQPAKNLRAITHDVAPGIQARIDLLGDVFEMEDQRNWTDASFKTYCTPLEIPYPVEIPKGTKISQRVKITVAGQLPESDTTSGDVVLTLTKQTALLPRLGLQVSGEVPNLTDVQVERLKKLKLDHLRVNLSLTDPKSIENHKFIDDLRRAAVQANALRVSLHVELNLGETPAIKPLQHAIATLKPPVSRWLVTGGDPAHFKLVSEKLPRIAQNGGFGVTRTTNFVDLNRARPEDQAVQAIGFAINPQVHAFDNASMIETLPIHRDAVNSARGFAKSANLVIGPITLAPQLLDGVDQPGGPPQGRFPTHVDVRQSGQFAAAWTLGSLKFLTDAGAHSATFYETVGWKGVMDIDDVSARPDGYPSRPGELFPIYHIFKEVAGFAGGQAQRVDSSDSLAAVGIALRKPGKMRILLANLSDEEKTITLRGLSGRPVAVTIVGRDEAAAGSQTEATPELQVTLPPYGIGSIDRVVD